MSVLTAVSTSSNSIIVIDEINSFLHPAAIKSLMRILNEHFSRHQYIISTHAPEVVSFPEVGTLFVVKRDAYVSRVETLDLQQRGNFREVAELLGVSMSDVFAADLVVWVEGPTEELCFTSIYRSERGALPQGLMFSSVVATGDFGAKRRDRSLVFEVYRRLSDAAASLTVSIAFSFDREDLSDADQARMVADSKGSLRFLPRRHLECYFLDVDAIAAFIKESDKESAESVTPARVKAELEKLAQHEDFSIKEWNGDLSAEGWLEKVDAANLINGCCNALTDARVTFNKKLDSLFLLEHMMVHSKERLEGLRTYVLGLVPNALNQTGARS